MINASTMIYDGSVDRAAMVRLYEERTTSKVFLIVDGHSIRVDKLIKASKLQGKGYKTFLKELDTEISKTMDAAQNVSSRSLLDLFKDQSAHTVQNLDKAVGKVWRTQPPPRRVAEDIVLNKPLYSNTTLEEGWRGIGKAERLRIDSIIRKGIAEGQTEGAIADSVMKGAFGVTKNQAKGLVVTATTSVYAQADHEVYKANEKLIQGWQYVAVLDSRTTPLCSHRDGTIYPISDTEHLPPAHWHCRSTTVPIVKSYEDLGKLEGIAQIRKRNFAALTPKEIAFYDGQTPLKESYSGWLSRQPQEVQLRHLGDTKRLELFRNGQLAVDQFTNPDGNSIGIRELRQLTDSGYGTPGDTRRFARAKEKLDTLKLGAARPDEIYESPEIQKTLREYYMLQVGELDGTLSLTNYRGTLLHNKKATKQRVLASPPREDNMKFNPITGVYNDSRMYQPSPDTLANALRQVNESDILLAKDKEFITTFINGLENSMGVNERSVISDNLRITIGRFRQNKEPWANLKAVLQGQVKFDVMNISDYMETQLRKDANLLHKLKQANYIDPVLGPVQLQELHDTFISNIIAKNKWDDSVAPKIAKELRGVLDLAIPVKLKINLTELDLENFYLKFAKRLSLADSPDRDQVAVALGRDLYNMANYRGSRNEWYNLGVKLLDHADAKGFYQLETFGVQKRRMKSRMGGKYFGPYYDTFAVNIRIVDPRIQKYAKLTRKVDVGLRVGVTTEKNKLFIRQGYKTYFVDDGLLGFYDTRIPITSTSSFSDFPAELIDKDMTAALNWTASAKYKIDPEFHDFVTKLLNFNDDKGKASYYHDLNKYREYMLERGDAYERLKAMDWLVKGDKAFSNHPFLDHRARIYERGLIGPQSGETFRPFLNTAHAESFSELGFLNLQDQIGAFLGGASDVLEHKFNSLSVQGRQQIAALWRKDLVELGNQMRRGKPNDIRKLLENKLMQEIDGEEQGKLMRFALEAARLDEHLNRTAGNFPASGRLFHVSTKPLDDTRFVPRVPKNFLTEGGFEDSTTARISFADNIDDALKAMSSNLKGKRLYVYAAPSETKFTTPSIKQVPDVKITSERWVTEPTEVSLMGTIDVGSAIEKPYTYAYGDRTANLYGWTWKINKAEVYSSANYQNLKDYKISLALEQDASSSGAQIIALTTKNKQLANLSNVIPTDQKQRLYDEIAASTFNDPRFRKLNEKLGLTEKDLRKASKAQNMVTFYGAGQRTGILNVEAKLGKVLGKEGKVEAKEVLDHFLDGYGAEIATRQNGYKYCGYYANLLHKEMQSYGIDSKLTVGMAPVDKDIVKRVKAAGDDPSKFGHAVVTIGDKVFDPTSGQFELPNTYSFKEYKANFKTVIKDGADEVGGFDELTPIVLTRLQPSSILVVKAADRDTVLAEISARMARYEKLDPEMYAELRALRSDVKDIFNKGLHPGDEIMDQLYFLDSKTRDLVEKMTREYDNIVTPDDFQQVAAIMSENLRRQVPILTDFTKFFGRLADDYLSNAKPSKSAMDYAALLETEILGAKASGKRLPKWLSRVLAIKDESIRTKILTRIPGYVPGSPVSKLIEGVAAPTRRRTGFKIGKYSLFSEDITKGIEIGIANKLDKKWSNVPWVNFDGKVLEQNFTQVFEERLAYKDKDGKWIINILQVPQKTESTWWEAIRNKDGKINEIADVNKARTAYAVNGNHSNDATLVKQFHLWGKKNNVQTTSIHDAFFTNAAQMLPARSGLKDIYGRAVEQNSIMDTLNEMRARGLPKEIYDSYLNEAIETGLIPVVGRSKINGVLMTKDDILTKADILQAVQERFKDNRYWYGIG